MGNNFSTGRGVKRSHEENESEAEKSEGEIRENAELHTPKRKRFQSTSKYIVKKLFEEGKDSDVTIQTLGKTWQLHKLYLSQCKYFDSMFNGEWAESEKSDISIEISDQNIDTEDHRQDGGWYKFALKIAFKSLYTDNILVKPVQAVGVLAAATFLQLEPLIEHCREVMKGCITGKTVCSFYAASECYGLVDVKEHCMNWLLHCLMMPSNSTLLSEITEELLGMILDNKECWILQVEVDIYTVLKKWVFLQFNPSWSGSGEQLHKDSTDFFRRQAQENGCCFLETEGGRNYIHMFEKVRWMYLVIDNSSIQVVKEDQIVPEGWLDPVYKFCWIHHLKVEQGIDSGPENVNENDFYKWAMRCGRVLMQDQEYHWRWLGYQYGLDLLFTVRNKVITMKRNSGSVQHFAGSLSQQHLRRIMWCVKIMPYRKKDMCTNAMVKSTGIKSCSVFADDADVFVLNLDQTIKFPLQVTMHLLCISPDSSQPFPSLAVPPPPVAIVPSHPPAAYISSGDAKDVAGREKRARGDHESVPLSLKEDGKESESVLGHGGEAQRGADAASQTDNVSDAVSQTQTMESKENSSTIPRAVSHLNASGQSDSSSASSSSYGGNNRSHIAFADRSPSASSSAVSGSSSSGSSVALPSEARSTHSLSSAVGSSHCSVTGSCSPASLNFPSSQSSNSLDRNNSADIQVSASQSSTSTNPPSRLARVPLQPNSSRKNSRTRDH